MERIVGALTYSTGTPPGLVVARKVANLQAVLRRKPLDRAAANALLRQLYTGVVVDYAGETKVLVLRWRQGGENTVVYGMDGERPKRRSP